MGKLGSVLGFFGGMGASTIVTAAATSHIPKDANKFQKACCFLGVVGLSWAANDIATATIEHHINEMENTVKSVAASAVKAAKETGRKPSDFVDIKFAEFEGFHEFKYDEEGNVK